MPCIYDDKTNFGPNDGYNFSAFISGLARVSLDGKCGFIDNSGKVVIPLIYDWAEHFAYGMAYVRQNDKAGYIDKTGKEFDPTRMRT